MRNCYLKYQVRRDLPKYEKGEYRVQALAGLLNNTKRLEKPAKACTLYSIFQGKFLIAFLIGLFLFLSFFGNGECKSNSKAAGLTPYSLQSLKLPSGSSNPPIRRSGTINILALRVEFVMDTLSTTSGDGSFVYSDSDSFYKDISDTVSIYYDPPPHDLPYFADHLEFLRFYWDKMSASALDIKWDIYPPGARAAYQLPKKMWQYNYNSTDEQLDYGLAQLFYDAIIAADEDSAIEWSEYAGENDLIIVFHAGAGAEFDLGYTTTPHDIPSAWLTEDDLDTLGFPNGIPIRPGALIRGGLILPETETHQGVQISMAGVIISLFGHWLGLPALYDIDEDIYGNVGNPVVGKWSLMDRGFGNFYGSIPGQLDVWSRSYMGWIEPEEISPDDYSIAALGFQSDDAPEAYRISIGPEEYFLLSCRARDPENDSIAVAYDRNGRRMEYNEDYSVDPDDGFRVPVRIDNLDFDAPGSGILIWHVNESLIPLISERRFNSVDDLRGLDLEEADGAQDIGENYPFLTPGWGTDYGIYTDAWYGNNEHHQDANQGRTVSFNDNSYPSSRSDFGVFTHVTINNFSRLELDPLRNTLRSDTVMSFTFSHSGTHFTKPIQHNLGSSQVAVGNFDNDLTDQEFTLFGCRDINIYDGDGSILHQMDVGNMWDNGDAINPVNRDMNSDERDEIIWITDDWVHDTYLHYLQSIPVDNYQYTLVDSFTCYRTALALGGEGFESTVCLIYYYEEDSRKYSKIREYNSTLDLMGEAELEGEFLSLHRFGSATSDNFLIVTRLGEVAFWHRSNLTSLGRIDVELNDHEVIFHSNLVDIDGSGEQDIVLSYISYTRNVGTIIIIHDPVTSGFENLEIIELGEWSLDYENRPLIADVDCDGQYELIGNGTTGGMTAIEANGVTVGGFPWTDKMHYDLFSSNLITIADLDGNGELDYIYKNTYKTSTDEEQEFPDSVSSYAIEIKTTDGRNLPGFPIVPRIAYDRSRLCQLDDDPELEFLIVSNSIVDAYNLDFSGGDTPTIWWDQPYRDADHSNAIWEPARPFERNPSVPLMPADKCYNWPNPARGSTAIRYFLNFPAVVKVDIYDITGERVKTMHGTGVAGLPNEIMWDLSSVARGGYIAIVEAKGAGKTDKHKIKIAVLK